MENTEYVTLTENDIGALRPLHVGYKLEIGEDAPSDEDLEKLARAVKDGAILFYGCLHEGRLIACCSVAPTFSTFNYTRGGVFEDFYILPGYRHKGIARGLVLFAYRQSGAGSLTVGCADCDREMYNALGFTLRLGNMLAFVPPSGA